MYSAKEKLEIVSARGYAAPFSPPDPSRAKRGEGRTRFELFLEYTALPGNLSLEVVSVMMSDVQKTKSAKDDSSDKTNFGAWAILISALSLFFSIYAWIKLFPLNQANIILSEPTIIRGDNGKIRAELTIKNIGKATAEDIKFTIYEFFNLEVGNKCGNNPPQNPLFNDTLFGKLGNDSSATFGSIILNDPAVINKDIMVETVLLSRLEYKDTITSSSTTQWFGWHFLLGEKEMKASALVRSDIIKYEDCLKFYAIPSV